MKSGRSAEAALSEETVNFMDDDPFSGWGLKQVELADQVKLNAAFASLAQPLSDYTFSQLFTWRNSLRIIWKEIRGHLCVFANGSGDLTLLIPPIGDTGSDRALAEAFELMDAYNAAHGVPGRSRIEYASEELLGRLDCDRLLIEPMGADYVYDVNRMIDLAGGDLASKRQAKNRFLRNYEHRVEIYRSELHLDDCLALLDRWKIHQDATHLEEPDVNSIKRSKESIATALCLRTGEQLGLKGMVVYVKGGPAADPPVADHPATTIQPSERSASWQLRGFTFGEMLGGDQSSITIEKTDLETKGLAQFIFSEFCRAHWAVRPFVNVGDDWGLPSLAWTKMSYRPVKLLKKFVLKKQSVEMVAVATPSIAMSPAAAPLEFPEPQDVSTTRTTIRAARKSDLDAALELERENFHAHSLSRRQLQYLQRRETSIFLVGEQNGQVVGDGIALVRQYRNAISGRIYSLVVRAESRGQKIGQKLLHTMIKELLDRGAKRIYLEVEQANEGAIRLYKQAGFRAIGVVPDYYGKGKPALHMMYESQPARTRRSASSAAAANRR